MYRTAMFELLDSLIRVNRRGNLDLVTIPG